MKEKEVTRGEEKECVSCLLPSPQQCSVYPGHLQRRGVRCTVRPRETLLRPEGPLHLFGVYPGHLPAPQKPVTVCAEPEACWSEHQPEVYLPGQTALKSGGGK